MHLHFGKLWIQKFSTVMHIDDMKDLYLSKFDVDFNFGKTTAGCNRIFLYLFRYFCCQYRRIRQAVITFFCQCSK